MMASSIRTNPQFQRRLDGGGTSYTQVGKASVSLSFQGSAVYVFGDKENDHGLYSVVLDNWTAKVYNGESGVVVRWNVVQTDGSQCSSTSGRMLTAFAHGRK
ncbi:hypothetical protein BD779DRAFT_904550 [Infundibulicybe gibba]|nr:hypothetical protein BD779DRAFT_904550 [Infundibulicybe gibba]